MISYKKRVKIMEVIKSLERQMYKATYTLNNHEAAISSANQDKDQELLNQLLPLYHSISKQLRRMTIMKLQLEHMLNSSDCIELGFKFNRMMYVLSKNLRRLNTLMYTKKVLKSLNKGMNAVANIIDNTDIFLENYPKTIPEGLFDSNIIRQSDSDDCHVLKCVNKDNPELLSGNTQKLLISANASVKESPIPSPEHICIEKSLPDTYPMRENNCNDSAHMITDRNITVIGAALRPRRLKDFQGQERAINTLADPINKAILMNKNLPHVLLCGSYGQGKTTLAKIIAEEMNANFIEITASVRYKDMLRTLKQIKKGDIIFIDEIHKLSTDIIETLLYPALEDFEIHYTEGNGKNSRNVTAAISPFTLIGATTESGKLLLPFYSKFPIKVTLTEYKENIIAGIIKNSFRVLGMNIDNDAAFNIAKRSRLSPRTANAHVEGIASSAIVREATHRNISGKGALSRMEDIKALKIVISSENVNEYFSKLDIDEMGLTQEDRAILSTIINKYKGGPVGQEVLAKALNLSVNRIDKEYEPFLIKCGFINTGTQGRTATDLAYAYMGRKKEGYSCNKKLERETNDFNIADDKKCSDGDSGYETKFCEKGKLNENNKARFNKLFSGESREYKSSLDELFDDVDKDYESSAKNKIILKFDNGRELYCDSKLEYRFLKYLYESGFIQDAKSECIELYYDSSEGEGKRYYPDFAIKLYDGRIALLEMKNLDVMGYHLNISKYNALQNYAKETGYLYAEIAKDYDKNRYCSFEQIKDRDINEELRSYIYEQIEKNGVCTLDDIENVFLYDENTVKDLITVLANDRRFRNLDRFGNSPRIIFD